MCTLSFYSLKSAGEIKKCWCLIFIFTSLITGLALSVNKKNVLLFFFLLILLFLFSIQKRVKYTIELKQLMQSWAIQWMSGQLQFSDKGEKAHSWIISHLSNCIWSRENAIFSCLVVNGLWQQNKDLSLFFKQNSVFSKVSKFSIFFFFLFLFWKLVNRYAPERGIPPWKKKVKKR